MYLLELIIPLIDPPALLLLYYHNCVSVFLGLDMDRQTYLVSLCASLLHSDQLDAPLYAPICTI